MLPEELTGRQAVLGIYGAMIGFAAVFGAVLGVILPARQSVPPEAALGPFTFTITPLSFAVYGAVSIALGMGVLILIMNAVSERYDDAEARELDAAERAGPDPTPGGGRAATAASGDDSPDATADRAGTSGGNGPGAGGPDGGEEDGRRTG